MQKAYFMLLVNNLRPQWRRAAGMACLLLSSIAFQACALAWPCMRRAWIWASITRMSLGK